MHHPKNQQRVSTLALGHKATSPNSTPATVERVVSIDALRGFDMFWIIGGGAIAHHLLDNDDPETWQHQLALQFDHVAWEGFRFLDLIFPLFLFLVGCVLPYSLSKYSSKPRAAYVRLFRRGFVLILLGLVYNGVFQLEFANMRYPHVLARIGIGYTIAGLLFLHTSWRTQAIVAAAILLGYWGIFEFIASPGGQTGDYSMQGNIVGYVDRLCLPGVILKPYYGYGDNEGILSTIPAIATALLGVWAGMLLRSSARPWTKVAVLAGAGCGCLIAGYGWGSSFPIIKNLWTSSFVLVAGGYSFLLLALFYAVLDVMKMRWLAFFWVVIGANAITIYMGQQFIDFGYTTDFFFGGVARLSGASGSLVMLIGIVAIKWIGLLFLYRKRIFLRV